MNSCVYVPVPVLEALDFIKFRTSVDNTRKTCFFAFILYKRKKDKTTFFSRYKSIDVQIYNSILVLLVLSPLVSRIATVTPSDEILPIY